MRRRLIFLPWVLALFVSLTAGCSYIHFGRIEKLRGDSHVAAENSDLRIQKKLLQEELAIAGRERTALQKAIEQASTAGEPSTRELVEQLAAAHREIETLRNNYANWDAERKELVAKSERRFFAPKEPPADRQITGLREQLSTTETKLAEALRTYSTLQSENQQLRSAIEQAHSENAQLTAKVQELTASNSEAQAALAQLNLSLLAQKEARAEAEKNAHELQAKVDELAHAPVTTAPPPAASTPSPAPAPTPEPRLSLAEARESSAEPARELSSPGKLPLAGNSPAIVLSTRGAKTVSATPPPQPSPAKSARSYVVRDGDSLEKIAEQVYGRRDRWILLYTANNALLSDGKPLKAGMTLQVPEDQP
jgi:nucleoid-associated protein YgaU